MAKGLRAKAEKQFLASQKKTDRLIAEREKAKVARAEKTERLRALRLAKEAEEKAADES